MHDYIDEAARKYHYWRGFRSAVIVAAVPIAALIYGLNIALDCLLAGF
jgi:hypothetical protein